MKRARYMTNSNQTWILSTDFRKNTQNIKLKEYPSSGSRDIPCGQMDGEKVMAKLSRFSKFCECAHKVFPSMQQMALPWPFFPPNQKDQMQTGLLESWRPVLSSNSCVRNALLESAVCLINYSCNVCWQWRGAVLWMGVLTWPRSGEGGKKLWLAGLLGRGCCDRRVGRGLFLHSGRREKDLATRLKVYPASRPTQLSTHSGFAYYLAQYEHRPK